MTDIETETETFSTPLQDDNYDSGPETTDTSTDTTPSATTYTAPATRQVGRCKWFSKGYGFIEGLGDDTRDFFVHHTQLGRLDTSEETDVHEYRYLMRGETVEFTVREKPRKNDDDQPEDTVEEGDTGKTRMMACNVTGIYGGPLMYQTALQDQEEANARYAARNGGQSTDTNQENDFTTVTHRRHGGGRGKGKGKGKGRYGGGKGRSGNPRWSHDGGGGGYYGQAPPQMGGYYGGGYGGGGGAYYGHGPPGAGYGQLPFAPQPAFGMQGGGAVGTGGAPAHQQGGYGNGFSALEE